MYVTPVERQSAQIDPLYDPVWAIFIYAAWALVASAVGETVGLVALLGFTSALGIAAVLADRWSSSRSFAAEFSAVLLFCAAAIAGAVLVLRARHLAPQLLLSGALFAAAAAILADLWRREKA